MSKKTRAKHAAVSGVPKTARAAENACIEAAAPPSRLEGIVPVVFAVILAVMLGFRPIVDGIVYPHWNFPFMALIAALFTVWAILVILRMAPVRLPLESAFLAGFVAWAAVGLTYTVQYDATFQALLLWASYACLFLLAASALQGGRAALAIVLGGFLFTAFAEGIWSLVHLQYVLPFVRAQVHSDPALLEQYFNVRAATGDLAHRLQSNRAFGTFLFPNALGAYMALAIPLAAAGTLCAWQRFRHHLQQGAFVAWARQVRTQPRGWEIAVALSLSILIAVALFATSYILTGLIERTDVLGRTWFQSPVVYWFSVAILPLLCGGATLVAARVYGLAGFYVLFRLVVYPLITLVLVATLYAAFTRGAMVALVLAAALTFLLLMRPPRWLQQAGRPVPRAAAILLLACTAAWAVHPGANAGADAPPQPVLLDIAGASPTLSDALSGQTFGIRIGYWRVGLRMWLDNFAGGVGLGNFGAAYPGYQFIGAMDVKTAHNDFLQLLAETGPIGFLLFTGFWVVFFVAGARRLLEMTEPHQRLMAAGLYAGLLAFVLHSSVDFNFVNASLAMTAFALAGAFHALTRAPGQEAPAGGLTARQLALLIPALAALAILAGAGTRAYAVDSALRRLGELNQPLQAASYLLTEAVPERQDPRADFFLPALDAASLLPSRSQLEALGMLVADTGNPGSPWRRVAANEPLRREMLLIIRNLDVAPRLAREAAVARAEVIAGLDTGYPHRPDVAAHLYHWYHLLLNSTNDPAEQAAFADACLKWAREGVARSRRQSWFHTFLATALWEKAKLAEGEERERYMEEGLEHFRMAAELIPLETAVAHEYARAMKDYGRVMLEHGRPMRGNYFISMGDAVHHRAGLFQEEINAWRYGTPTQAEDGS